MKRKLLCIVMALALCLGLLPGTTWAATSDDEVRYRIDGGGWQNSSLINAIKAGEASTVEKSVEIELNRDITLTEEEGWTSTVIGENGNVSWTIDGKNFKITNGTTNQIVFTVTGTTLTLKNITVDGGAVWEGEDLDTRTNSGIHHPGNQHLATLSEGATLILESGAVLQNNDISSWKDGYGAAVNVGADSTLIMKDGSAIRNNYAEGYGGGVFVEGTFNMLGGSISENAVGLTTSAWDTTYSRGGGGVYLWAGATFEMTGGAITKNQMTKRYGCGVYVAYNATFTLTGGEISENTGNNGSGIGVYMLGTFEMSGGEIKNNSTPNSASSAGSGGGVYIGGANRKIGTFTMNGGSITGNVAYSGGGVYVNGSYAKFNLSGGNITENQARWGGGIYLALSVPTGYVVISGSPVIANNADADGKATNVYLNSRTTLTINSPLTLSVPIGVNVNETTAVKEGKEAVPITKGEAKLEYFFSDNLKYILEKAADESIQLVLRKPCDVIFDTNSESEVTAPENQTTTGEGKLETLPEVTRTGYTFAGWFTEKEGGTQVTTDTVFDKETTVYAHWATNSYAVTFVDSDSGSQIAARQVVKHGEKATEPEDPTKDGYDFLGWFTADGTDPFAFDTPITSELTLTAHWKEVPSHNVTFYGVSDTPTIQIVRDGEKAKRPADPVREGFRFVCWCVEDSSDPFDFENTPITEDVDLTAIWHQVFTVTFINEAGTVAKQGVLYLRTVPEPNPEPTRTGYTFAGWFTDAARTDKYDFTTLVTGDLTLYAKWDEIKYDVTFNSQGGSAVDGQSVTPGSKASKPADPTRSGYTFGGWYKEAECENEWDFDTDTVTGEVTLYAKWTANSSGGGSGSSGSSGTTKLPVNTTGQNSSAVTTTTTAAPAADNRGGTASAAVSSAVGSEIVKQAVENNSESVVIAPQISGNVTSTEISIPASTVGEIGSKTGADLTVSSPVADVTIPNSALDSLSGAGGAVTVTAERADGAVELTVTAGGKAVESIPGGVKLTVPVTDSTPGTVAVLIHEDGTREVVRKSVAEDGSITVPLDGSAKLEIVDNSKQFSDVPADSWAADAVAFASAHELFSGTGEGQFSPDLPMSRAMLAVVLYNLESNPEQALTGVFADVSDSAWYARGVEWAASTGIVSGYGNGLFGPNESITREQLAVMLWRYAGSPAANTELNFKDADAVSGYALEAMRWAVENGILNGYGNGLLGPQGLATRAQVAQMLKNYMCK